jgi:hypothetical protein
MKMRHKPIFGNMVGYMKFLWATLMITIRIPYGGVDESGQGLLARMESERAKQDSVRMVW